MRIKSKPNRKVRIVISYSLCLQIIYYWSYPILIYVIFLLIKELSWIMHLWTAKSCWNH
jgi:hypothetical protein